MKIILKKAIYFLFLGAIFLFWDLTIGQNARCHQIKVLIPLDRASIISDRVHFIVEVDGLKAVDAKLEIGHNSLFNKEVRLRENTYYFGKYFFHFPLRLDTGLNKLKLCLVGNNGNEILDEINMDLSREADGIKSTVIDIGTSPIIWYKTDQTSSSDLYEPYTYRFHTAEQELLCIKCHDFNIHEPDSKKLSCCICHKELSQDKHFAQQREQVTKCLECHRQNQKGEYRFKMVRSDICITCHEKRGKNFNRKYLHSTLECGECWICHKPHNKGKIKYGLRKKVNQLCTSCHGGKHSGKIGVNNHPILSSVNNSKFGGKEYQCTNCHDPHGSDADKFQLLCDTKGTDTMCKRCHLKYY